MKINDKMKTMRDLVKILFAVMVIVAIIAAANKTQAIGEDFSLQIYPENPGPNKTVEAKVVSYSFDVDRASITWILNGETELRGTGEKSFKFTTGGLGSKTTLSAVIAPAGGSQLEKAVIIRPADVDILWQADTYVPPPYAGKALASAGTSIKIAAIPHFIYDGSRISPLKLVYDWEINGKKNTNISGYGKISFTFKSSSSFSRDDIRVVVTSAGGALVAEDKIFIDSSKPEILFYKESPLEGVNYHSALSGQFSLIEENFLLRAEPYFFSNKNMSRLKYEWKMNNKPVEYESAGQALNIQAPAGGSGSSLINLKIENPFNIFQFAENSLMINFGI